LLVKILAPCLPFLMGLGQKAVEKGADELAQEWDKIVQERQQGCARTT